MKTRLLSLLFAAIILASCGSNKKEETIANDESKTEAINEALQTEQISANLIAADEGIVQQANYDLFTKNIYNKGVVGFDWKLLTDKPVVVDFYADWCRPCKMIAPIMQELAAEYKGKIHFIKVDTDVEGQLAYEYEVQGIPMVMLCPTKGGPQKLVGAMDKASYVKAINDTFGL
ncbi:MAG: redoxin domain-containing protein [Bacteroidales bacterium]|jgi:thioredoxin|nr:redoxin domain-containing protein [Bacteroidales bacterium]